MKTLFTDKERCVETDEKVGIAFVDLQSQRRLLGDRLTRRMQAVLEHGVFIMGPEVAELEERLADFVGVRHAVTCSSGTDALLMALMALRVGVGDAVFTTPFTFVATAEVIALLGATPVFVDVDPQTFNMDPDQLEKAVRALKTKDPTVYPLPMGVEHADVRPRGVIAVDLFGLTADYVALSRVARENDLFILEDAAQSFGAVDKSGKKACAVTEIAATSFFPAKPLGCYGDGGAVFTEDAHLAEIIRSLRVHGKGTDKYDNVRIGINGRLDTLQAAVVLAKMDIFPQELDRRQHVAERYTERLKDVVRTPYVPQGYRSAWAQYTIVSPRRAEIRKALQQKGIPSGVYYPKPLHLQEAFAFLGYKKGNFPVSENLSETVLSLPMHPYLSDEQVDRIADTLLSVFV